MPVNEQKRASFANANKPKEVADPPDSESPAKTAEPEPQDGELVALEGEGGGGGGEQEAQAAAPADDSGEQAAKTYNFKVGGVDFNIQIVDAGTHNRRQHVFHRMNLCPVFANGRATGNVDNVVHFRVDGRTAFKICPIKSYAAIGGRRLES